MNDKHDKERLDRIREEMMSELEKVFSSTKVSANTSHAQKPPQYVVDAYLHQVAVQRWQSERWQYLASAFGSVFYWAYSIINPRALQDLREHRMRTYVSLLTSCIATGFSMWRFVTPPAPIKTERETL